MVAYPASLLARRRSGGYTVLEVVVATALLSLVVGSIYSVFVYATKRSLAANVRADMQHRVRVAIDRIASGIREGSRSPERVVVYDQPGCSSCAIGLTSARNAAGQFQLVTDPARPDYAQPDWQGVVYIYLDGTQLKRHVDYTTTTPGGAPVTSPGTDEVLLSSVRTVEFLRDTTTVRVRIVAENRGELTAIQTDLDLKNR